ncbi:MULTISPECIES: DUF2790 domain-containing protein [Pseudomonas]|jgi:hypothetical protein|uniref:DUF2790 domain-containing protein n=1 Tax=Pseudomonas mandelii JR-1 TaxID=1147786 RepID=A0A024EKU2_9PSED|nr:MULTISPECIES: DUF2790 domain-containing protein [Pseudomonas]MDZ4261662.1 DUF2790 domain-containing protein [Pseudomonadota bacterium]AHZ73417.1 hypothetical protein OU5_P0165 [Pseudomonas mandelii JR-1]PMV97112.1 DUF2790 domain-containing protein [Pseudomonas sp. GW460-C8]PMW17146.1 DUF2790 domain-containing protein [Pseudomonas sp. GW456-11-11-14-TSB2]PMW21056.1 DUF2790 domain-containing protein [Pseudomonas sp. GW456-E6]
MKTLIALFLAVAASSAIAANDVQADRTGVPSDVAKIISITDTRFACGIVPVELVYQDSLGVRRVATYMVEGGGCQTN